MKERREEGAGKYRGRENTGGERDGPLYFRTWIRLYTKCVGDMRILKVV